MPRARCRGHWRLEKAGLHMPENNTGRGADATNKTRGATYTQTESHFSPADGSQGTYLHNFLHDPNTCAARLHNLARARNHGKRRRPKNNASGKTHQGYKTISQEKALLLLKAKRHIAVSELAPGRPGGEQRNIVILHSQDGGYDHEELLGLRPRHPCVKLLPKCQPVPLPLAEFVRRAFCPVKEVEGYLYGGGGEARK